MFTDCYGVCVATARVHVCVPVHVCPCACVCFCACIVLSVVCALRVSKLSMSACVCLCGVVCCVRMRVHALECASTVLESVPERLVKCVCCDLAQLRLCGRGGRTSRDLPGHFEEVANR